MPSRITQLVLFLAVALVATLTPAQEKEPAEKPSVEQLIQRLTSDDFETREAATRALKERPDALPQLRKALTSDDPELRRRAAEVIEEHQTRDGKRQVRRALSFLKSGEIDTFVDLVTSLEPPLDDEICQAMCALVEAIVDKANKGDTAKRALPAVREISEKKPSENLNQKQLGDYHKILVGRLVARDLNKKSQIDRCIIVSKEKVELDEGGWFRNNILFTNGDLIVPLVPLYTSVIICDGSIKGNPVVAGSIVIARSKANHVTIDGVAVVNHDQILSLVKFFDPLQLGIEAGETKGGVAVKQLQDGKPFAAAGVREGDLLTAIDGAAVDSPDSFRRLLRARRAAGGEFLLKLRRADATKEVTVRLTD
jgi:hypothetical protein